MSGGGRVKVCREADVGALVGIFEKWMEARGTRDLKLLFKDWCISFTIHRTNQPSTHPLKQPPNQPP
eukprot:12633704-Alexandrium_andersonii.AAC.1